MIRLRDSPKDFQASVYFYGLSDKIIKKTTITTIFSTINLLKIPKYNNQQVSKLVLSSSEKNILKYGII
jgi:hypothetical protein